MCRDRLQSQRLLRLSQHFPVTVVSGARQVGKRTLLQHLFPTYDYVVFDASNDLEGARRAPDLFLKNHQPANRRIAAGAIICAVDRPHWIEEDVMAIPWNMLRQSMEC